MPKYTLERLSEEVVYLRGLASTGCSLATYINQATKVTRLFEKTILFRGEWFEEVLASLDYHIVKDLELINPSLCLSNTYFGRYHRSFVLYLRGSVNKKDFEKVLRSYRRIYRLVSTGNDRVRVREMIQEIKNLLARKKKGGEIS